MKTNVKPLKKTKYNVNKFIIVIVFKTVHNKWEEGLATKKQDMEMTN